ncbi:MAG: hypothetical protein V1897_16075 [Pseudomonadota bacterium]
MVVKEAEFFLIPVENILTAGCCQMSFASLITLKFWSIKMARRPKFTKFVLDSFDFQQDSVNGQDEKPWSPVPFFTAN